MNDEKIIKLYNEGYSMKYISNIYYKYKSRKLKPIKADGVVIVPVKLHTKSDCELYVYSLIYSYILRKNLV